MPKSDTDKQANYGSVADASEMGTPRIMHLSLVHQDAAVREALLGAPDRRTDAADDASGFYHDAKEHHSCTGSVVTFASLLDEEDPPSNKVIHDRARGGGKSHRPLFGESFQSAVDRTFSLGGDPCDVRQTVGTASLAGEIFNLVKNLVGAGALGLPSGIAAFGDAPSALIPASVVILLMGAIFAYYFLLMGRICRLTDTATYREAWEVTMGKSGAAPLVALFVTLMASLGNLAYSMILADTTRSLLISAGMTLTRTQCLWAVTLLVLWPLCNVKRLTVLAPFSFLGMAGMLFTVGYMGWRCFDGTYAEGGKFVKDLPENMKPSFGTTGASGALSPNVLLLCCMCFQSYFAHYNAPRYYVELKDNTIDRFSIVVNSSFSISALIYVAMSAFGFLTFGANSDGFVLNNYSTDDALASTCRIAIAVSLALTYPLPFMGMRDGVLDLLSVPMEKRTSRDLNALTVVLLVIITLLAMYFDDLGLVNAVGGALFGTAVVFIFPALMFRAVAKGVRLDGVEPSRRHVREALFAVFLMWVGIGMGITGCVVAFFY